MKTVLAILVYTLSLFGIDVGSHIRIDRVRSNGTDALYSRVVAQPTGTRFECVRSDSGQCFYTVFAGNCVGAQDAAPQSGVPCASSAQRFAIANGDSRQLSAVSTAHMCVSTDATTVTPDCR